MNRAADGVPVPVIEFRNVARSFRRGVPVLADVSFSIHPGEVVGLLGRNGAGKTTLVRIAMGMLHPHAGSARVFGLSPTDDAVAVKRRVGYVAEDQALPPRATIAEMLALHRHLFPTWDDRLAEELLGRFGLAGRGARLGTLSKGQARQVALVCAASHRPDLLLLDEPAGGLDPAARREFLEMSIRLLNIEGTAILFSSHHMGDVERLGGRIVLLDGGTVLLDRQLDELRENYCVAIVPCALVAGGGAVAAVDGCLRVRETHGDVHAVFHVAPDVARASIHRALGVDARCATVSLEELFVELVGDRAVAAA